MTAADLLLQTLISTATLVGSRGRARYFGYPEPDERDYDYCIFADFPFSARCTRMIEQLCEASPEFRLKRRLTGVTAHAHELRIDISVCPAADWPLVLGYWRMREAGASKQEAAAFIDGARRTRLEGKGRCVDSANSVARRG